MRKSSGVLSGTAGKTKNVEIQYCARIDRITKTEKSFVIRLEDGTEYETSFVLNASYASVNQILQKLENVGTEKFKIKYELCEIILCKPTEKLKPIGLTVMDGPFFQSCRLDAQDCIL